MEDIPPPVKLHFGRNGFNHASSSNIYDWVSSVNNSQEVRVKSLKDMDEYQDTITSSQKKWVKSRRQLRPPKFKVSDTSLLTDYNETSVLKDRKVGLYL